MPTPGSPAVDLRQVSLRYPKGRAQGLPALAPIDLRIDRGEFVSLVGPSGCGKSTLLRLVAGLLNATAGEVVCDKMLAGRMAFVFQSPALMPWATVADNVRLPLTIAGSSRMDIAVEHALGMVGLRDFRDAYLRELSGGMQMRVSIARALATQPGLMLLDEPFAALDEITRGRLDIDLRDLWRQQALTIIFVTHSIYEAIFLSTCVIVMSSRPGRVVGELTIDEPHPRGEAFRSSEKFVRYCAEASRLLRTGMDEAAVA